MDLAPIFGVDPYLQAFDARHDEEHARVDPRMRHEAHSQILPQQLCPGIGFLPP